MTTMAVRPASARLETLFIVAAMLIVAGGAVVLARTNAQQDVVIALTDWQLSSFDGLNAVDRATYSELYAAGDNIRVWREDSIAAGEPYWPTAEDLAGPYEQSPFVRDVTWKQRGEVEWRLIKSYSFDGGTAYLGTNGKLPGQSAYLLIISHVHKGASYTDQSLVWIHPNPKVAPPETLDVQSLVRKGWKQVMPYRGADEVRRLRGDGSGDGPGDG